jgi:hypothetical protein
MGQRKREEETTQTLYAHMNKIKFKKRKKKEEGGAVQKCIM